MGFLVPKALKGTSDFTPSGVEHAGDISLTVLLQICKNPLSAYVFPVFQEIGQ